MDKQTNTPEVFRLNIEVGELDHAIGFYDTLLGVAGRRDRGARVYYSCGAVTLQVVDTTDAGGPHPLPKGLYFMVNDIEAVFERAKALRCVSLDDVHGESGGDIVVRPWGERSFYAYDPWGNPLCFVDGSTVYAG